MRTAFIKRNPLPGHDPLKCQIYNCYHYLNHYNLFGSSYLDGCEQGLRAIHEAVYR
ncbi:fructosamine kinase family protein [Marinobacterium litorale]|uniref:fructosamine kinase family protein n=1 Tax=Marinobacterium litorale TaxID=404770 RepID=UPI000426ECB1|nr:fructosamine kinase family protein [Marinobacterium litorale]